MSRTREPEALLYFGTRRSSRKYGQMLGLFTFRSPIVVQLDISYP